MSYENRRKRARQFYKHLKPIPAPSLGDELVVFNSKGFRHLIRKSRIRSKREQIKRFLLLFYVPRILANPKVTVTRRKIIKGRIITRYWALGEIIQGRKIIVVIRQINQGVKHFYSVMPGRSKSKGP
jgi:hypothetical protein